MRYNNIIMLKNIPIPYGIPSFNKHNNMYKKLKLFVKYELIMYSY